VSGGGATGCGDIDVGECGCDKVVNEECLSSELNDGCVGADGSNNGVREGKGAGDKIDDDAGVACSIGDGSDSGSCTVGIINNGFISWNSSGKVVGGSCSVIF